MHVYILRIMNTDVVKESSTWHLSLKVFFLELLACLVLVICSGTLKLKVFCLRTAQTDGKTLQNNTR